MYFIAKLDAYEIEDFDRMTMHVGNAKKSDDLSKYKKVKKLYSLMTAGDNEEESKIIKVFLFEELANEELERILAEDQKYWKGYEVIEYGQELRDTISTFMDTFKFQITAVKQVDKNGKETGNVGKLKPCDFDSMVLQAEEMKEDLKLIVEKRLEKFQEEAKSTKAKVKYSIVKALDWCFTGNVDLVTSFCIVATFTIFLLFWFNSLLVLVIPILFFIHAILDTARWIVILAAQNINIMLFYFFKKLTSNYYK